MVLNRYTKDFESLIDWLQKLRAYENAHKKYVL